MDRCPSEEVLADLLGGRLRDEPRERVLEHLDGCDACRAVVVAEAAADDEGAEGSRATARTAPDALGTGGEAPARSESLQSGTRVGRYLILSRVGEGGMGVIYAAYDPQLDRKVALKLLLAAGHAPSSEEARARLLREAQAMARLSHPNVSAVYDVGTFGSSVFVAMELVLGMDLRRWLAEKPRPWREALSVLIAAGRGLAAAHAARLVHRDVKPDNVLVGNDGRVRITDFGLARAISRATAPEMPIPPAAELSGELEPSSPSWPRPSEQLTRQGVIPGTPAYMAPEQLRGNPADARSDQFSFCVMLYEALYGRRPFGRPQRAELARGAACAPREPPADSPVPAHLRKVILTGLALDPAVRFPSMDALLAELSVDPRAFRVRWAIAGAALLSVASAWGAFRFAAERQLRPCRSIEAKLDGVWDAPVKEAIRARFLAVEQPYAADAWRAVEGALDAYAAAWVSMDQAACEATVKAGSSIELPLLQRVCLERRRTDLGALAEVLAAADAKVVAKAFDAAAALPPLARCADGTALRAPALAPRDEATRARVEQVSKQLARVKALLDASRYAAALDAARPAVEAARAIDHPPLLAEALLLLGRVQLQLGDAKTGVGMLEEAELAAEVGRSETTATEAAIYMIHADYLLGRIEHGRAWQRRAEAYLRRLGPDDRLQALFFNVSGNLAREAGELRRAVELYEQAIARREKIFGPEHPSVAAFLHNEAIALEYLGELPRALVIADRNVAINTRAFGPEHPSTLRATYLRGLLLSDSARYDEAVAVLSRTLEAQARQLGWKNPLVGDSCSALAGALAGLGRYPEAYARYACAREVVVSEKGPDSARLGQLLGHEASLLLTEGKPKAAVETAQRALATFRRVELAPDDDRWVEPLVLLGTVHRKLGRDREALPLLQQALGIRERALGAESGYVAFPLLRLGELHLRQRRFNQALPLLERALALDGKLLDPTVSADIRFALAQALWEGGGDRSRARQLAEQAKDRYAAVPQPTREAGLRATAAWLSAHRAR